MGSKMKPIITTVLYKTTHITEKRLNKDKLDHVLVLFMGLCNRYLLRFFDCLAHPNLSATFATDQK
jgi:hypothetical protein